MKTYKPRRPDFSRYFDRPSFEAAREAAGWKIEKDVLYREAIALMTCRWESMVKNGKATPRTVRALTRLRKKYGTVMKALNEKYVETRQSENFRVAMAPHWDKQGAVLRDMWRLCMRPEQSITYCAKNQK